MNDRVLTIIADKDEVACDGRLRLRGKETLGLYPGLFTLECWNLSEDSFLQLSRARMLHVWCGNSCLAFGDVSDLYRRTVPEGEITTVAFAKGLSLWKTPVCLSVVSGKSVSETVSQVLSTVSESEGPDISLLSWPCDDPVFFRGQAFHDRAALCLSSVLSAAGAKGNLIPAGLCVIPDKGLPVSIHLTERDLVDAPSFTAGNLMVISTLPIGWQVGATVELEYGGYIRVGIIVERGFDLDTNSGSWKTELLVELK